jgi:hypothetical protein
MRPQTAKEEKSPEKWGRRIRMRMMNTVRERFGFASPRRGKEGRTVAAAVAEGKRGLNTTSALEERL